MEQVKKNWLGWFVSSLIAFLTVILTTGLGNASRDNFELKAKIDSKLDKSEFTKHCDKNDADFNAIQDNQNLQLQKISETLQEMLKETSLRNEQQAKMSTDIEWIKRKIQ